MLPLTLDGLYFVNLLALYQMALRIC